MVWRCSARRADEGSLPNRASSHNRLQFSVWDFAPSSPREPFCPFLTATQAPARRSRWCEGRSARDVWPQVVIWRWACRRDGIGRSRRSSPPLASSHARIPPFPKPWTAERIPGGYLVRDGNGMPLAYVYGRDADRISVSEQRLTADEARRISRLIARLPSSSSWRGTETETAAGASHSRCGSAGHHRRFDPREQAPRGPLQRRPAPPSLYRCRVLGLPRRMPVPES